MRARLVAGTWGGALFEIVDRTGVLSSPRAPGTPSGRQLSVPAPAAPTPEGSVVAVTESRERGAAEWVAVADLVYFDACSATEDAGRWIRDVRSALASSKPVVVDNLEALNQRLAVLITAAIRAKSVPLVMISAPLDELDGWHRALASIALTRHDLQPLRTRPHRLSQIITSMLTELSMGGALDIAPSVV